ncbi:MAG TPA: altronate dehydratase family protein [Pyrinomonadaceae bacterium]|nr:altronate dehydratase family protein [Pyrinomonadaceae bacterium]
MRQAIRIHSDDNVAVALQPLAAGAEILPGGARVLARSDIPRGHKVALAEILPGEMVFKYGFPIGRATQKIGTGEWVHTHNLETALGRNVEYHYRPAPRAALPTDASTASPEFMGYRRDDGKTGTRNEIWIINTVACVNNSSERIARAAHEQYAGRGVEGVYSFPHPYGCSQLGDDLKTTQKVLAGLINHPNAGGVLVLGLGCENNAIKYFVNELGGFDPRRVKFLNAQDAGDEIEEGVQLIGELAEYVAGFKREPRPVSELVLGMKCGGSDGLSGITANPLVGRLSDFVTGRGGTALLTEVPEMFGAEQLLMNRAADEAVYQQVVRMINDFKDYFRRHGQPVYENPSPGNREGGITTLEEKSLGAIQKGGRATVTEVINYAETATRKGLVLVEGPGNDGISSTAEVVAGANLLLFTTGRGTPLGVPVPTIKISTNTELAHKKPNWIDFDAGALAGGETEFAEVGEDLLALVLKIASGEVRARNELNGFREIAIFKTGVTL